MLRRPPNAARAFLRSSTTSPSSVSMRTSPFSNTPRLPGSGIRREHRARLLRRDGARVVGERAALEAQREGQALQAQVGGDALGGARSAPGRRAPRWRGRAAPACARAAVRRGSGGGPGVARLAEQPARLEVGAAAGLHVPALLEPAHREHDQQQRERDQRQRQQAEQALGQRRESRSRPCRVRTRPARRPRRR